MEQQQQQQPPQPQQPQLPPNIDFSITATQVFNSLRIPDAIKDLPKFDGNPRLLHDFIKNVEEILSLVRSVDGSTYAQILLRAIRNKIEGQANEVLNMYGTPLVWDEIKNNLILHYSDKRNETSLIRDLHSLKQHNKSVEKFYSEVVEIQAALFNHIQIHEKNLSVVKAKKDMHAEMCLNVFLSGLREPLGSTIRAMRPESLPIALSYCIQEQNIFYTKSEQSVTHPKPRPSVPVRAPVFQQRINYPPIPQRSFQPFQPFQSFRPNPTFQQQFQKPLNNSFNQQQRQHTPYNQQPRPSAPNPFYRQNLPKPEPMEIGSGNSRFRRPTLHQPPQPNRNFSAPPNQRPRFMVEELFNTSEQDLLTSQGNYNEYASDYSYTNLDRYYYNHPDNDQNQLANYALPDETGPNEEPNTSDENFPASASTNPSAT